MKSVVLCAVYLLLLPAMTLAFNDADVDDVDDLDVGGFARTRRGWSMMRLGRGLQMLRLGKRTAPPAPSHTPQATPEKMRELLGALLEDRRKDFRRQPPMPRYGRELNEEEETLEELFELLGRNRLSKRQLYPYVHGGRFQRSAPAHVTDDQESDSTSEQAKDTFSAGS